MNINLSGIIGYHILYDDVEKCINNCDGDINVYIDSGGGSAIEGMRIYNMFKNYDRGVVNFYGSGIVGSAASFICLAGNLKLDKLCQYLYHEPYSSYFGAMTYRDGIRVSNNLKKMTEDIFNEYVKKSKLEGMLLKSFKEYFESNRLMTNEEILRYKVCDEVIDLSKPSSYDFDTRKVYAEESYWDFSDGVSILDAEELKDYNGLEKVSELNKSDRKKVLNFLEKTLDKEKKDNIIAKNEKENTIMDELNFAKTLLGVSSNDEANAKIKELYDNQNKVKELEEKNKEFEVENKKLVEKIEKLESGKLPDSTSTDEEEESNYLEKKLY